MRRLQCARIYKSAVCGLQCTKHSQIFFAADCAALIGSSEAASFRVPALHIIIHLEMCSSQYRVILSWNPVRRHPIQRKGRVLDRLQCWTCDDARIPTQYCDQRQGDCSCFRLGKGARQAGCMIQCRSRSSEPLRRHHNQVRGTDCILHVQQECIFRRLINDDFVARQYNGKALLITACGNVNDGLLLKTFFAE